MVDLYLPRYSAIHLLDARVKFLFTLGFILFLNLSPVSAWAVFILFLSFALSLALLSRLGLAHVLKRSLLVTPFLLAALSLLFTSPPPYFEIGLGDWLRVQISIDGLLRLLSISLRAWISMLAAVLLTATTRFPDLVTALQQLKVPGLFIAIISLMGRYLFVMIDQVRRMLHARASRSAAAKDDQRSGGSLVWRARVAGGMAGSLFLRSIERSERVYTAMLARGYDGKLPVCEHLPIPTRQRAALAASLTLVVALWVLSLLLRG